MSAVDNKQTQYKCMERLTLEPAGTAAKLGVSIEEHQVLEFMQVFGCVISEISGWQARFDMRVPTCADYLRALFPTEIVDQECIDKLYKYSLDFLYGMVFRHAFELTGKLVGSIETQGGRIDLTAFTVGVHTRHSQENVDNSSIEREAACMEKVVAGHGSRLCQVLIMSDREESNAALAAHAQKLGCQGIRVVHDVERNMSRGSGVWNAIMSITGGGTTRQAAVMYGIKREHGPFAGAGFWKDLALVTQAQHALWGRHEAHLGCYRT